MVLLCFCVGMGRTRSKLYINVCVTTCLPSFLFACLQMAQAQIHQGKKRQLDRSPTLRELLDRPPSAKSQRQRSASRLPRGKVPLPPSPLARSDSTTVAQPQPQQTTLLEDALAVAAIAMPEMVSSAPLTPSAQTPQDPMLEVPAIACDVSDHIADIFDNIIAERLVAETPLRQQIRRRVYRKTFIDSVRAELKMCYGEQFPLDAICASAANLAEKLLPK